MIDFFNNIFFWIGFGIVFLLITTFILKKFFKVQTFYIGSLVKTTKKLEWLDKFTFLGKWLDRLTEIGLVVGFGILASDYLYGRDKEPKKRILIALASIAFLSLIFLMLEFFFGMENPFIKEFSLILYIAFLLFGFSGFTLVSLLAYGIYIISNILVGQKVCPGIAPVIPGVEIPNMPITIPWHAWISLLIILIVHEGMHGIVARKEGLKIKSWGLLLAGIFPIGAFVEPDDEELKNTEPKKALHMLSAGPTANFASMIAVLVLFNIFFLLIAMAFGGWASGIQKNSIENVYISQVDQNIMLCGKKYDSPSLGKLHEGMIVKKINDKNVSKASILSMEISSNKNKPIKLTVDKNGIIEDVNIVPTEFGVYGFRVAEKNKENYTVPFAYKAYSFAVNSINNFIIWFIVLSLLMAMSNFLPTEPFDGGKIAKILLLPYLSFLNMPKLDTERLIGRIFSWIILAILIVNAIPLFL